MQNFCFCSLRMCRWQIFHDLWTKYFIHCALSCHSLFFLLFLLSFPSFLFPCWTFTILHFDGKGFCNKVRLLKLFWRKKRCIVEQEFPWNFLFNSMQRKYMYNPVLSHSQWLVTFFGEFKLQKNCNYFCSSKSSLGYLNYFLDLCMQAMTCPNSKL